jgi:hypothetical protein
MRRTVIAALAASMLVSACGTGFNRLTTYTQRQPDARTTVDGKGYNLFVHPIDDTILVQRGVGAALGQSFVEGATFGAVKMQEPMPLWRRAAEWLANPVGCTISEIYELERISWEAPFSCPAGVDLRKEVEQNHDTLRQGQPLPPTP